MRPAARSIRCHASTIVCGIGFMSGLNGTYVATGMLSATCATAGNDLAILLVRSCPGTKGGDLRLPGAVVVRFFGDTLEGKNGSFKELSSEVAANAAGVAAEVTVVATDVGVTETT